MQLYLCHLKPVLNLHFLFVLDYKCALHRDILLQGHLYLSQHHVCFHANIFGWVTHLVVAYDEIISMEKRNTAIIIPNGIQISTAKAKVPNRDLLLSQYPLTFFLYSMSLPHSCRAT